MARFLVFLSLTFALLKVTSQQLPGDAKATFSCTNNGGINTVTVTYTFDTMMTDPHNALFAKDNLNTSPCSELRSAATSTTQLQVVIPLDACGIAASGTTLASSAFFYLTKLENGLLDDADFMLEITSAVCDFTSTLSDTPAITMIDITGLLADGAITPVVPTASLTLVADGAPGTDILTCVLGADVKLKLTVDLTQGGVTGAHARSCTAMQVGGSAIGPIMILDASCTTGMVGSSPDVPTGGFTYDGALSTAAATPSYISVMTSKFDCFRWDGSTTISITCTVDFCTSDITVAPDNLCQDGADTCQLLTTGTAGLGTRKRRDVEQEYVNSTLVSYTINIGQSSEINQDRNKPHISSCPNHIHNTVFIAVVVVLGGLLFVAMAMTCFLASRLRRSVRSDGKGIDNPSF